MALEPRLILLDEPDAGMNFEEKEEMGAYIVDLNERVRHDRDDDRATTWACHGHLPPRHGAGFGRKIAEGDPASVLADPHVKRAYLGERTKRWSIPTIRRRLRRARA